MFMAEKGMELPMVDVDICGGESRREPFLTKVNSRGQCPVLEMENGQHLTEIIPICEYLEEKHPTPPMVGATAEERAETRMWTRRVDLAICEPLANGFRASEGYKMFKDRFRVLPEAADGLKAIAQDNLQWLDGQLANSEFLCGSRFSMADVLLYCMVNFGANVGQPLDPEKKNVVAWFERVAARPSAKA
jgi:glutathione S-transferase